jgi:hypothetical protein
MSDDYVVGSWESGWWHSRAVVYQGGGGLPVAVRHFVGPGHERRAEDWVSSWGDLFDDLMPELCNCGVGIGAHRWDCPAFD